jgi:hypothetical protein
MKIIKKRKKLKQKIYKKIIPLDVKNLGRYIEDYPFVEIEWQDIEGDAGWSSTKQLKLEYQTLSESAIETYRVKGVIHSSTIPQLDLELVHTTPDPVPVSHWTELRSVLLT